ncbi:MAG: tRNA pseudouridine(38-40) synthase TruA [Planctomycetales bacterium]
MRALKLTLAYDGSAYAGWQIQTGQATIQSTLETALAQVTGESIRILGSGRTDAGVHALGQVAGLSTQCQLEPEVICRALNARLPDDIRVLKVEPVVNGFRAIADATSKLYRYVIHDGTVHNIFSRKYCWHYAKQLDVSAMAQSAGDLVGTHDFSSFQSTGAPRESTIRTVSALSVTRGKDADQDMVIIEIEADGFLYKMVRAIVGTLVEVGRGAKRREWPSEVLAARDRSVAGATAPPHGLFLVEVHYGD